MLTKEDVGKLFTSGATDAKGQRDVWRMKEYKEIARVEMINCDTGEGVGGTTESLEIRQFKRLVVEEEK